MGAAGFQKVPVTKSTAKDRVGACQLSVREFASTYVKRAAAGSTTKLPPTDPTHKTLTAAVGVRKPLDGDATGCSAINAKVGAKQAPVEFEACWVEIDIDIGVQHRVEMAQREDPPLEQRAVLEV